MTETLRQLVDRDLAAIENRDVDGVLACFAPHGELIDPHYPHPHMRGHAQIRYGLDWVLAGMQSMSFEVRGFFESADGTSAVAEAASRHVQTGGRVLEFTQLFIVDTADGLITRMESYLPYGPDGAGGFFLRLGNRGYRRRHPFPVE
jgi:ketosteroid isomerase-like protein